MTDPDDVGRPEAPSRPSDITSPDTPVGMFIDRRPPLWSFVLTFWKTRAALPAWGLMAVMLCTAFGSSALFVWANKLSGETVDAITGRKWADLQWLIVYSSAAGLLSAVVANSGVMFIDLAKLRWRTWLSDNFMSRWTSANTFYDVERENLLANADQRIAEDVNLFAESSLNLFSSLVTVAVSTVTMTILVWQLSRSVSVDLFGRTWDIHGYMVPVAFAYTGINLLLTHFVGRRLMALTMAHQGVEGDYRFLAMQLRENAEQIALYQGGEREHRRLVERFAFIRDNVVRMVVRTWKTNVVSQSYSAILHPLPTVLALPLFFTGQVTYGGMMRAVGAFSSLTATLAYFPQSYIGFTTWFALANRLRDLSVALDDAHARHSGIERVRGGSDDLVAIGLSLQTPQGVSLTTIPQFRIGPGDRVLVRGPSGTGKSTLLRAIAGIWPYGQGTVQLPQSSRLLFLPQRSYIPSGTLQAALAYPSKPSTFSAAQCAAALTQCGLTHLVDALGSVDRWQQKLSGGEQQRLAFARVFLQKPNFIFLDEATSALDPEAEATLYQTVLNELPRTGVVSIAHRESLVRFHDSVLHLESLR